MLMAEIGALSYNGRFVSEEEELERLGRLLLAEGVVTQEALEAALANSSHGASALGVALNASNHIRESDLVPFVGADYRVPRLEKLSDDLVDRAVVLLLPAALLRRSKLIPIARLGDIVVIAFGALPGEQLVRDIRRRVGCSVKVVLAEPAEIDLQIDRLSEKSKPEAAPRPAQTVEEGIDPVRLSAKEYKNLAREYGDAIVTRWTRLYTSGAAIQPTRVSKAAGAGD